MDGLHGRTKRLGTPPLNLVYADTRGNIGWAPGGITPVRPNWDGLMPVPGDGRYNGQEYLNGDLLPSSYNPKEGWIATANEMNLPAGYPADERKISFEWSDPTRITRIKQVLGSIPRISLANSMALQTDSHSAQSERLTKLLAPLTSPDPAVNAALSLLKSWDHDETVSSPAAAIYEVWLSKHLGQTAVQTVTPAAAREIVGAGSPDAVITYLEHPDSAIGPDPAAARDALCSQSRCGGDGAQGASWSRHVGMELGPAASRNVRAGNRHARRSGDARTDVGWSVAGTGLGFVPARRDLPHVGLRGHRGRFRTHGP